MDKSRVDEDLIIEMLEVMINCILYIRKAYPAAIFKKQKMYNTAVYISIYPTLNDYISNVLKSASMLLKNKQLQEFEIAFTDITDNNKKLESFIVKFDNSVSEKKDTDSYEVLLKFNENLRKIILSLDERCKNLKNLPTEFNFKINLYTSHASYLKLLNNVELQDFPWIMEDDLPKSNSTNNDDSIILPLNEFCQMKLLAKSYL